MRQATRKIIFESIIITLIILFSNFTFAQNCPEKTTVNGPNSITFVGGVVDLGGDTEAKVWFEYGTSSGNYTFQTEKLTVTKLGKYCITVSNLQPCTTYYYRAAIENTAGPSYGAELSKTTPCSTSTSTTTQATSIKPQVLGTATQQPTGLIKTIFTDFLFVPLLIAFFLTFALKSHLIKWEEWMDKRKEEYAKYKSKKLLALKITQIKFKEKSRI